MQRTEDLEPHENLLPEWDPSPLIGALEVLAGASRGPGLVRFDFGSAGHIQVSIDLDPAKLARDSRDQLLGALAELSLLAARHNYETSVRTKPAATQEILQ